MLLVAIEGDPPAGYGAFALVRRLRDGTWFVDVDPVLRWQGLVVRHVVVGRCLEEAERWVSSSDEPSAVLVAAMRDRPDLVMRLA